MFLPEACFGLGRQGRNQLIYSPLGRLDRSRREGFFESSRDGWTPTDSSLLQYLHKILCSFPLLRLIAVGSTQSLRQVKGWGVKEL